MTTNQERFIVVPNVLTDVEKLAILTDISFWSAHEEELKTWCAEYNSEFVGMTVVFPDEHTLTLFLLKWQ